MYCPECGAEYRQGFAECADCEVLLVDKPVDVPHDDRAFVTVFRTADASLLPVVKSLLESAEVPYLVQGEETALGLYPLGFAGGGSDGRLVGAVIRVPQSHSKTARALLNDLESVPEEGVETEQEE